MKVQITKMMFVFGLLSLGLGTTPNLGFAAQGGGSTGGGFANYHDTGIYFEAAADVLIQNIDATSDAVLDRYFLKLLGVKLDKARLIQILRNLRMSPAIRKTRTTPDGGTDYLIMDYGTDENGQPYIEALQDFFDVVKEMKSKNQSVMLFIEQKLFHECMHHFGVTDDNLAWLLSDYIQYLGDNWTPEQMDLLSNVRGWLCKIGTLAFATATGPSIEVQLLKAGVATLTVNGKTLKADFVDGDGEEPQFNGRYRKLGQPLRLSFHYNPWTEYVVKIGSAGSTVTIIHDRIFQYDAQEYPLIRK